MTVETTLYSRLTSDATLSGLVGTRVAPGYKRQDGTLPAISYQRISSQRYSAMGEDSGVVKARFQFDVWAATYESAISVKEALRGALQRWSTTSGTVIFDVFLLSEIDLYEDDTKQHHMALDFEVNYRET